MWFNAESELSEARSALGKRARDGCDAHETLLQRCGQRMNGLFSPVAGTLYDLLVPSKGLHAINEYQRLG